MIDAEKLWRIAQGIRDLADDPGTPTERSANAGMLLLEAIDVGFQPDVDNFKKDVKESASEHGHAVAWHHNVWMLLGKPTSSLASIDCTSRDRDIVATAIERQAVAAISSISLDKHNAEVPDHIIDYRRQLALNLVNDQLKGIAVNRIKPRYQTSQDNTDGQTPNVICNEKVFWRLPIPKSMSRAMWLPVLRERLCQHVQRLNNAASRLIEGWDSHKPKWSKLHDRLNERTGIAKSQLQTMNIMELTHAIEGVAGFPNNAVDIASRVTAGVKEVLAESGVLSGGGMSLPHRQGEGSKEESSKIGDLAKQDCGTALPHAYEKAKAVYEWALGDIEGATQMTLRDLHYAIKDKLESVASGPLVECQPELLASLPRTPETFRKYLNKAGIKRYKRHVKPASTRSVCRSDEL